MRKKASKLRIEEVVTAYLFLLPFLVLWIVWFLMPLIQSINMSLYDFSFIKPEAAMFVGIDNYQKLFRDPYFWKATGNTLFFVAVTVPATLALSLPVAAILNSKIRGRTFFRTAYYMPNVISSIAVATVFMYLFVKGSFCSKLLSVLGLPDVTWFTDVGLALPFVMIIYVWQVTGFYVVIYLAGLQTISTDVYEAAKIDGAGTGALFFRITVPLLRPTLVFGLTYSVINSFQVFDQIAAISQNRTLGSPAGATSTMVTFFYSNAFQYYDMGYGCAAAIVLFVLILVVSLIQKKLVSPKG